MENSQLVVEVMSIQWRGVAQLLEIGGFCNHRDAEFWRLCLVMSPTGLEFALDGGNSPLACL